MKADLFIYTILLFGLSAPVMLAGDLGASMSSDNFRVLDAQHAAFGGIASSSSSSFRLVGAIGDLAIGSSSATSFALQAGFLTFQLLTVSTPTPTPTPTPGSGGGGGGGGGGFVPTQTPVPTALRRGDVNGDGRVDLIDFSILAFWWQKTVPSDSLYDLNADSRVDLIDFSILVFWWTG